MTLTIPIFPLGTVLYPGCQMPLHIFEERYQRLLEEHGDDPIPFGVTLLRNVSPTSGLTCSDIGTAAVIVERFRRPDNRWDIRIEGFRRFRILHGDTLMPWAVATIEWLDDDPPLLAADNTRAQTLRREYRSFERLMMRMARKTPTAWTPSGITINDAYQIASHLPLSPWQGQTLLEERDPGNRLASVIEHIERERALLSVGVFGKPMMTGARFMLN